MTAPVDRLIVAGIGNPLLGDDGAGICVARALARTTRQTPAVTIVEQALGGLALMELLVGYDRAILVDAMQTGAAPGTIHRLAADWLQAPCETQHSTSVHDLTLSAALTLANRLALPVPRDIRIWGIEPQDMHTFREELSPPVACAVPLVADEIAHALGALATRAPEERDEDRGLLL